MKPILCLGDSNTWGYDPRGILENRYGPDTVWCGLLGSESGIPTVNLGENGRKIPASDEAFRLLNLDLKKAGELGMILVMLGTNDILQGALPETAAARLEQLLDFLGYTCPGTPVVLLSPAHIRLPDPALCAAMEELSRCIRALAEKREIPFCDVHIWALPLSFDGVHFSETGHRKLARNLLASLRTYRLI